MQQHLLFGKIPKQTPKKFPARCLVFGCVCVCVRALVGVFEQVYSIITVSRSLFHIIVM